MNAKLMVFVGCLGQVLMGLDAAPFKDGDVVVFFGDSITHGGRYHAYIADYYLTRFPSRNIRFVNSGIAGDTAAGAFQRIPEDVAEYAPTHVAFHFGMNDIDRSTYLPVSTSESLVARERAQVAYRANMCKLIEGVRKAAPDATFIYLTPTPYEDRAVITNAPTSGWASVNQVGCNVGLSLMAGFVIASASAAKAEAVDWYSLLNNFRVRHQKDDPKFRFVRPDRVHPEEIGHSVMAWEFLKRQGVPSIVSEVEIDARSGAVRRAENAEVSGCQIDSRGAVFTVLAKSLPFPVHEKALPYLGEFDVENALNRETVRITGLVDGLYALKIDGVEVGCYAEKALSVGVALGFNAKTPQYRQAQDVFNRIEKLRQSEQVIRNYHAGRWFYSGRAPVDDVKALGEWFEKNESDKNGYYQQFVPGYLEYWPKYRMVREQLRKEQEETRKLAQPLPRRYEIAKVSR